MKVFDVNESLITDLKTLSTRYFLFLFFLQFIPFCSTFFSLILLFQIIYSGLRCKQSQKAGNQIRSQYSMKEFGTDLCINHVIYILFCLFVCLFVSNKRQIGWTDRAFVWYLTRSQGRLMDDQNKKNSLLGPSKFDLH